MLLVGARTIERPRVVEPPDDGKGYRLARLDEVSVRRLSLGAREARARPGSVSRRSHPGCKLSGRRHRPVRAGRPAGTTSVAGAGRVRPRSRVNVCQADRVKAQVGGADVRIDVFNEPESG